MSKRNIQTGLALLFLFVLFAAGIAASPEQESSANTPYEYPVLPGTPEWIELGNVFERRRACQIPEEILHNMTTEALLQTVLNYPFLCDIYAFNTLSEGYETVKRRFNGLQEFESRPDYLDVLEQYCQTAALADEDTFSFQDTLANRLYSILSGNAENLNA